jgi:SWI/SNF-related matrix-associated actin-dependent regulator 1 of chromatin subfamily A
MGLGKTVLGLAYLSLKLPALIICPASLVSSWKDHIGKFLVPDKVEGLIDIVSFASLHKARPDAGKYYQCLVVDEAHYLKREESLRSRRFCAIHNHVPNTLLLTGTPAQRNCDVFHLLKIVDPVRFPNFLTFANRYCIPQNKWIGGGRYKPSFTKNNNCEELAVICREYMLRMRKSDVLTLPPLHRRKVVVGQIPEKDRVAYKKEWKNVEQLRETRGSRAADVVMLKLCRDVTLLKLPAVLIYLQNWLQDPSSGQNKVIMFYHHRVIGDWLEQGLGAGTPFVRIDGQTSTKDRAAYMTTFEKESTCRVGLFSLCVTSTGLNLQFCQRIMYAELTFLSVHHTQSEARVYRIGQTSAVTIEYLIIEGEGSTDGLLWQSMCQKRKTEHILFDSGDESSRSLEPI